MQDGCVAKVPLGVGTSIFIQNCVEKNTERERERAYVR